MGPNSVFAGRLMATIAAAAIVAAMGAVAHGATAEDRAAILQSCGAVLQMSGSECNCIADLAEADLGENEYAVFVAAVTDPAQMNAAIGAAGLSGDEAISVMNFLASSPGHCQNR